MDPVRTFIAFADRADEGEVPAKQPGWDKPRTHHLCVDADLGDLAATERSRYNTPESMTEMFLHDQRRLTEPATVVITPGYRKWEEFGNIDVAPTMLTVDGLTLHFRVNCNPEYMAEPHDLVPVFLEAMSPQGKSRFMVALLRPTWPVTSFKCTVTYTLPQLAQILHIDPGTLGMKDLHTKILSRYSEAALIAQWLAEKEGRKSANSPNHESGGLLQKGGSGKVRFRPIDRDMLIATETVRQYEWNMGERLRAGRPIFETHKLLLAENEEMSSTLEAESEYLTDEITLDTITGHLVKLAEQPNRWPEFGIKEMTKSRKVYTDTYYDLDDCLFLRKKAVLRRRSVATDPDGTFLFTVKGKAIERGGEVLRIGAQVRMNEAAAYGQRGVDLLRKFLADDVCDNPVCRVLLTVLDVNQVNAFKQNKPKVTPVMTIESERSKFAMKLMDGTVIEFSADKATGTAIRVKDRTAKVCSFEFGVGHPGLNAATTATSIVLGDATTEAPTEATPEPKRGAAPTIIRPYHVPLDLNFTLLTKTDYVQYVALRDKIIADLFQLDVAKLERGGNKARTLAVMMDVIKG
jgi:hypothetical protein